MKTLILFSTRDGQTREIASFLASELKELGIDADTLNLNRTDVVEWHHYDRVVIGASIRYGHFHPAVDRFVKKHLASLQALPGAFFSVNLVARKPEKRTPQTNSYTRKVSAELAVAAAELRGICRRAALPALQLVRSVYDPPDYENDRGKRIPAKKWSIPTGNRYPGLLGKSHKWRANSA